MAAPATYELSGRNRVPADERTMYQLRAEQYLWMLTGIDAEEALNRGLDFEYNNAIYAVMDALYLDDQSAGKTSETVADWSVSYNQSTTGTGAAVYDAARPWLVDTGLLYRGCD